MAHGSKREVDCQGTTHVTSISENEMKYSLEAHIGGCNVKSGFASQRGDLSACNRGIDSKELPPRIFSRFTELE